MNCDPLCLTELPHPWDKRMRLMNDLVKKKKKEDETVWITHNDAANISDLCTSWMKHLCIRFAPITTETCFLFCTANYIFKYCIWKYIIYKYFVLCSDCTGAVGWSQHLSLPLFQIVLFSSWERWRKRQGKQSWSLSENKIFLFKKNVSKEDRRHESW